ncbi:transmembrane protein 139 [Gracilinanus agilis]|uniref:transmembrane protein 139 n=1 Tax=Gracilinanus agilis TaxID=191870 RepID=UPI001CFE0CA6|nr:transmembrane protein 139 [Gracilinanus agilis]
MATVRGMTKITEKFQAQAGAMLPCLSWGSQAKLFAFMCCIFILIGFVVFRLHPGIFVAHFIFIIGAFLLFLCLLSCFMEWGLPAMRRETTGALSSARDNEAFEVPNYEEAVVSSIQVPNSGLGEPPPYSTVIPSQLQEEESNHLAGLTGASIERQRRSEGTMTQTEGSLGTPNNLQLPEHPIESEIPPLQSLPGMEPLTPPPAYELRPGHHDINDDNVFDDDSVFYED